MRAIYKKRDVCACGDSVLTEDVPLGTVYNVDPESVCAGEYRCGACGRSTPVQMIQAAERGGNAAGFLPLGILELQWD